ncbi:hypothetical protein F2Q70_00040493 [Brassica cretica]|uniref:Uncharacterized protein n=1 Tax=Brassica cretica TaxID=69181 RepID=A0A8S9K7H6_BRACR|nr:hypothetical protein F2Q70_00040493 [Brassica cretica]
MIFVRLLCVVKVWDVLSNEEVATVVLKSTNEARQERPAAANAWRQKYPTAKVDDIPVVYLSINKR